MSLVISDPATLEHLRRAEWRIELRGPSEYPLGYFRPVTCSLDEPTPFVVIDAATVERLRGVPRWVEVHDPAGGTIGTFEPLVCEPNEEPEVHRSSGASEGRRLKDILSDLERRYGS